jgi:putative ABC transport system permease protein
MVFFENFRVAFAAIGANKLRSLLTMLGIIIGVAAVVAVVSIVQGLEHTITSVFQGVGANYIMIFPGNQHGDPHRAARQVKLTIEDAEAIAERVPEVTWISPLVATSNQPVRYRDRTHTVQNLLGVNEEFPEIMNFLVERGRFFSHLDLEQRRNVVVIGPEVAEELVLGPQPIGKEISLGKYQATVIGVMEEKGQFLGENIDNLVFLPLDSALALVGRDAADRVQIRIKTATVEDVERVRDSVTALLRQRHKIPRDEPDDFTLFVQEEFIDMIGTALGRVTAVVGGVVGVALLVGGIGIMNIMLVSVTERTREIGVRKAVGARRQDVLVQFLIEAVTLSLVGGSLGLAAGYGLGAAAASMIPDFPPAHVPLWTVLLAFGFSTLIGVFFGSYPAAKASRLDPIDALRYE